MPHGGVLQLSGLLSHKICPVLLLLLMLQTLRDIDIPRSRRSQVKGTVHTVMQDCGYQWSRHEPSYLGLITLSLSVNGGTQTILLCTALCRGERPCMEGLGFRVSGLGFKV